MTSRGHPLSVTAVTSPQREPRHHILAQEMERICIDTLHSLLQLPLPMRVPPESRMVVKRFPSRTLPLPVGEVAEDEDGRANNGNVNRKMLAPSQADDVPRAQRPSQSPAVTALPKESQGIVYWHKKWSVSVSIRSIHCLRLPLNARAARKSDGRKTVSVPAPLASLWERWPSTAGGRRRQITATSIGKCWHLRRQMTSRGRKALSHLR